MPLQSKDYADMTKESAVSIQVLMAMDAEVMLNELAVPAPVQHGAIKRIRYSHDAMVDLIIANPCISQNHLAAHFGYTASWVSQIIASDTFQARLAERRDEIVDPTIRASVEENLKGMLVRSMAILREKLDRPSHMIPDNLALRTAEMSSKALGYGARPELVPGAQAQSGDQLERLGDRLVDLLERKRQGAIINGQIIEEAEVISKGPASDSGGGAATDNGQADQPA